MCKYKKLQDGLHKAIAETKEYKHLSLAPSTIGDIIKGEKKWRDKLENGKGKKKKDSAGKSAKYPKIEAALWNEYKRR